MAKYRLDLDPDTPAEVLDTGADETSEADDAARVWCRKPGAGHLDLISLRVTTDHAQSSYGLPVLVDDDGRAYGPGEIEVHDPQRGMASAGVSDDPGYAKFQDLARAGYRADWQD